MADINKDIQLTLELDDQGTVAGIKAVNGEVMELGTKGAAQATSFGDAMDVALGNLAATAAEELASQIGALIAQGNQLLKRSASLAETQSRFNTVFGDSASIVEGFIEDTATSMGLSDAQAQSLISSTGALAQAMNFGQEESAQFSTEVASLAGDFASFQNADPQQAFEAINDALTGERERLKQFDVVLKEAEVTARAMANTGVDTADALTDQAKATATLELITEKAGVQVGDLERTSDSAANTGRSAGVAFQNLVNTFAQQLLPAASAVNSELLELAESEEVMEVTKQAALALSDALVEGIQLISAFVKVIAESKSVISENREGIALTVEVVVRLSAAVGAYVAVAQSATIATGALTAAVAAKNVVVAASRKVWAALTAIMSANPIGLVAAALALVIPLLWKFRARIVNAGAAFLEFGSTAVRAISRLIDWMQELVAQLPDMTPGIHTLRAGMEGVGAAADGTADKLDEWADGMRGYSDSVNNVTEANVQLENQLGDTSDAQNVFTRRTDTQTDALDDNTRALEDNAEARQSIPLPQLQVEDELIREQGVDMGQGLVEGMIDGANAGEIEGILQDGLIRSISAADQAISELQDAYDSATTQGARDEIQALIDRLQAHRDEMDGVRDDMVDFGPAVEQAANDALVGFGEAIGEMIAGTGSIKDVGAAVLSTLADLAQRVGSMLISFGLSMQALQTIITNPVGAIIAGTGLVALASAAKAAISRQFKDTSGGGGGDSDEIPRFAEGVRNFRGGRAIVGEEGIEMVDLPPGTNVYSNAETMAMMNSMQVPRGRGASEGGGSSSPQNVNVRLKGGSIEGDLFRIQAELEEIKEFQDTYQRSLKRSNSSPTNIRDECRFRRTISARTLHPDAQ
mgnify:CR=1 FL=1